MYAVLAFLVAIVAAIALGCEYSPRVREWLFGEDDDDDIGGPCGGET